MAIIILVVFRLTYHEVRTGYVSKLLNSKDVNKDSDDQPTDILDKYHFWPVSFSLSILLIIFFKFWKKINYEVEITGFFYIESIFILITLSILLYYIYEILTTNIFRGFKRALTSNQINTIKAVYFLPLQDHLKEHDINELFEAYIKTGKKRLSHFSLNLAILFSFWSFGYIIRLLNVAQGKNLLNNELPSRILDTVIDCSSIVIFYLMAVLFVSINPRLSLWKYFKQKQKQHITALILLLLIASISLIFEDGILSIYSIILLALLSYYSIFLLFFKIDTVFQGETAVMGVLAMYPLAQFLIPFMGSMGRIFSINIYDYKIFGIVIISMLVSLLVKVYIARIITNKERRRMSLLYLTILPAHGFLTYAAKGEETRYLNKYGSIDKSYKE